MLIGIGCSNVHRNGQVGMIYWGLAVIDPASYVAVGIFTFSWRLRQLRSEVRQYSNTAQPDQLKHLTSANDILMGLTLVTAICAIGVTQSLDSLQNKYVLPAILVLTSIWTFAESAFEILTMLQQANEAANSANSAEREFKNKVPGIEKQKIAFGAEKP
ncbi:hypothetical protein BC832DRAFT_559392 [Gaertneriomyces semiglobifer]|nr:hypothetical protein BC832DRAFT_559392 [Gaertneriomyces semiglobifer]